VRNQTKFHLQKSFWYFKSLIKIYGKILEKGWKGHFLLLFKTSPLKFVHKFWLEAWNVKQFSGDDIWFDFPPFFSPKFFDKNYSTMPKWNLNSTKSMYTSFNLTMSGWALAHPNQTYPIWFVLPLTTPLV